MNQIYVITYHKFNHEGENRKPLDQRLLSSSNRYIYYLIDEQIPKPLENKEVLFEKNLDPFLYKAGGSYLGEWSFLLAEAKHSFCSYPFFMISSRFYEKNSWLYQNLDQEWDSLFSYLSQYGWGYLPSYDRPLYWVDMSWEKQMKKPPSKHTFWPFYAETFQLIEDLFKINIPRNYRYTPFLFCNYIGFHSREHLLQYVNFYEPLFRYFFDDTFAPIRSLDPYVKNTGQFRNEKPFTFLIELLSHLFFYKQNKTYMALHYDGYYEINEKSKQKKRITSFQTPLLISTKRQLGWYKNLIYQKISDICHR